MRFPAVTLLVLLTTTAFAATPRLGPAVPVSAAEYGPTTSEKWTADIATDGEAYFVVWNDRRRSPSYHIYGTRVSADGRVLDPAGIPFGRGDDPAVVWNGRAYVVAWHAFDGYRAAMLLDGAVTATTFLGPLNTECAGVNAASNGNTVVVATCGRDVFVLDRDLNVVGRQQLATKVWTNDYLGVAASGDEYLIAAASKTYPYPVVTQKIDAAGTLGAPVTLANTQGSDSIDITSNGSEWFAIWREFSNIVGRIIARNGSETAPPTVGVADVNLPHPDRALYAPAIAWNGSGYVTMYMRGGYDLPREMFLARLDAAGARVGTPVRVSTNHRPHDRPDLAIRSDGTGAAAWLEEGWSVRVGLFDNASIATDSPFTKIIHAASGAHEQLLPAVERAGNVAVAAWLDSSIGTSNVRVARIGASPLLVAENTAAEWLDVLYDGSRIWVAWFGNGKLGVRRYTADLTAIDATPLTIDPPEGASIAVAGAAGNGALLVVYRTLPLDYLESDLVATVIRADGTVRDVAIPNETEGGAQSPVAVWDGSRFFVAWRTSITDMGDPPMARPAPIRALYVTPEGDAGSAFQLTVADTGGSRLLAAPSAQGIVLAWNMTGGWRIARYSGATPLDAEPQKSIDGVIGALAPLASGEVDVYWWTPDFETATITLERFSAALTPAGDRFTTPMFPVSNQSVALDATVIGTHPVLVHTQVDDRAAATGISRLFTRQTGTIRRRAVR